MELNYREHALDTIERNILIGSILGDGNLCRYGRSINALYREHGSELQKEYRKWKADQLADLDFKYYPNHCYPAIKSPSDKLYTYFMDLFYIDGVKSITKENIKLLDHIYGIACLYMDDGSLVIDSYKKKNGIHLFPRISLYTQSFTKDENHLLLKSIDEITGIAFKLKYRKDGTGVHLELNKRDRVIEFLGKIKESVDIPDCMKYKFDVESRLYEAKEKYCDRYPNQNIVIDPLHNTENKYSEQDEERLLDMISQGMKVQDMADELNRSIYSVYDKRRRMKMNGLIMK